MHARSIGMLTVAMLAWTVLPPAAWAADFAVIYSIDTADGNGVTVQGEMTVEIVNLSDGAFRNVNLRLDLGGANIVGNGLIQFGFIEAGDHAVALAGFRLEQEVFDGADALPWRVDFDDMFDQHDSIDVLAVRAH